MAEKPAAEKTEQPTGKKLSKARSEGQVPQSIEFVSAITITVLVASLALLAPGMFNMVCVQIKESTACNYSVFANSEVFNGFVKDKILTVMSITCPILTILMITTIITNITVSGPNFTGKAIKLKFDALNPVSGFGRLFNMKSLVKLGFSIVKIVFISFIVWLYLRNKVEVLGTLRWAWTPEILASIGKLILGLMIRICVGIIIIGLADLAFQKWKYIQDLKMTKQEVKDEHKETEGSPEIKKRIRTLQFQAALQRITQEIPKANVILVNPTHYAVALKYDAKSMEAPLLLAKGVDHMAEKIREIARANGIPIIRRPELTRTIYATVKPAQNIPPELYVAVAEVLALIYRLKKAKQA